MWQKQEEKSKHNLYILIVIMISMYKIVSSK